jgi:hypothetical protein
MPGGQRGLPETMAYWSKEPMTLRAAMAANLLGKVGSWLNSTDGSC